MELGQPTPASRPPSLEWHRHTMRHTLGAKAAEGGEHLCMVGCTGKGTHFYKLIGIKGVYGKKKILI